ncbi:MAG: Gfo/Idh/MocA family oxidoreductase [archaeon]|nr:Gfo/Idh/MocA family oxidoreductase [archaeon]
MRVAIVGNGNIYNLAHVYAWQSLKDVEIQATCDIIPERAEKACKDAAAKNYYTNMDDLLSNDDIDVIDLCVPTYEHARLSIAALKVGKHVICEKPMSRSLESAVEMLKAAEKSGKGLYIGHTRRFDQRWKMIKAGIDSGKIGMPLYIRRCERSWLPFPSNSWYWDFEKSGGVLLSIFKEKHALLFAFDIKCHYGTEEKAYTPFKYRREEILRAKDSFWQGRKGDSESSGDFAQQPRI